MEGYARTDSLKIKPEFDFGRYNINMTDLKEEAASIIKLNEETPSQVGLFTLKSANRWIEEAKSRPIPKMLFGELWFEGELCILFADTNLGKSILAVQIANSISRGEQINGFKLEVSKQPVLYFDFELSDKQFENRYSDNYTEHYHFDQNFVRVEINPEAEIPINQSFESYLIRSLETSILESDAKVLIVDNLTYLKNETEKAKDASQLMKQLNELKKKYMLSLLVLAHTPKRDLSKPITRNDLQGSKMLMNFCDSAFSIGESSHDKNVRYLKQIKARNTVIVYDSENVCTCQVEKTYNFLQFGFLRFGNEREHLITHSDDDRERIKSKTIELNAKGLSLREIGSELGISHMKVSRILKECNKV